MLIRPAVVFCLCAAPLLRAEAPGVLDYALPGSTFFVGIKVKPLVESPVARKLAAEAAVSQPDWRKMVAEVGFDPLKSLDEMVVFVAGEGSKAPTLAVLRGNFAELRKRPGLQQYHGVPIVAAPGDEKAKLAVLNDSLALAAEMPVLRAAIDRRGQAAKLPPGVAAKLAMLSERYAIYGFGNVPSSIAPPAGPKGGMADATKSIDQFQFGINLDTGFTLSTDLHARTPKDALALSQMVQLFTMMAAQKPGNAELMKKLDVKLQETWLHIGFSIPEAEIEQAMQQGISQVRAQLAGGNPSMASPSLGQTQSRAAALRPAANAPAAPDPVPSRVPAGAQLMITASESDGGVTVVRKK